MLRIRLTPLSATAVALVAAAGLAVPFGQSSPAPHHARVHLAADSSTGVVSYDSEGVTVSAPVPTTVTVAPAAASADTVMSSFRSQDVPKGVLGAQIDAAAHTVSRQQVTELLPVSPEVTAGVPYAAWVVTYTGLPPVSYAPAQPPAGVSCTFVAVMSLSTGHWTEFFSSCA